MAAPGLVATGSAANAHHMMNGRNADASAATSAATSGSTSGSNNSHNPAPADLLLVADTPTTLASFSSAPQQPLETPSERGRRLTLVGSGAGAAAAAAIAAHNNKHSLKSAQSLAFKRSMYTWVAGKHYLGEPWLRTAKAVAWHNVHQSALGLAFALLMVGVVWLHQHMQTVYLERWQAAGGDTRVQHNSLGPPAMFTGAFAWTWVVFYTLSALTSVYASMYLWVAVVTRFHHTKTMVSWMIGWAVAYPLYVAAFFFFSNAFAIVFSQTIFVGPVFIMGVVSISFVGMASRKHLKFPKFGLMMGLQTFVNALVFFIYLSRLPKYFMQTDSEILRIVIRLVVHPLLFEIVHATHRIAIMFYPKHLSEKRLSVFIVPTAIVANLLGRFLVASMETVWGATLLTVLLGIEEIVMRLTTPVRDFLYLRLMFGYERASSLSSNPSNQHIKGDIINVDMLAEFYGIFVAPFIVYMYHIKIHGTPAPVSSLVASMVIQLVVEVAVDFAPMAVVAMQHKRVLAGIQHLRGGPSVRVLEPIVEGAEDNEGDTETAGNDPVVQGAVPDSKLSMKSPSGDEVTVSVGSSSSTDVSPASADEASVASTGGTHTAWTSATQLAQQRTRSKGGRTYSVLSSQEEETTHQKVSARALAEVVAEATPVEHVEDDADMAAAAAAGLHVTDLDKEMRKRSSRTVVAGIGAGGTSMTSMYSNLAASEILQITSARQLEDLGDEETAMSLADELRNLHLFTSLSSLVITSINVWNIRFKHYEVVMFFLLCGWTTYFMRSFFYPGNIMCGEQDAFGDWSFIVCLPAP